MRDGIRRGPLAAFALIAVAVVAGFVVRWALAPRGPGIEIVDPQGMVRFVTLGEIRTHAVIEQRGSYQNQFGSWGGDAVYSGVRLRDLLPEGPEGVAVIAADGYEVRFTLEQLLDDAYPVAFVFCVDGVCMPDLDGGFRIAILPEDGDVSNQDYGVDSAGSYWVRDVVRLELE